MWCLAWLLPCAGATAGTVYFTEDFERPDAPAFTVWYKGQNAAIQSAVTNARAFSGKHSALVESSTITYFEIPLPKPLQWDRTAPDGIGNKPLYLSAHVFAERILPNTDTLIGFQASIAPKRRPTTTGSPVHGGTQGNVAGRTNEWLHLVFDVQKQIRECEARGDLNPDHLILASVSMISYGGGKFYVDDIRLADTPPPGWTPPPPAPPAVDAAAYFRRDPRLEAMVLHGCYGGIGSALGDVQLHPWVMRDMHRHYLNFAGPSFDFRFDAPERQLREFDLVLEQAKQFQMPVIPMSYIGSRYAPRAVTDTELKAAMQKIVGRYRDNPWLLAWYLEEEPGHDRAATYLKEKRWVDETDPNHNCLMIFNAREGLEAIGPAQSVVLRDIYPIGGPNPNPWLVPLQVRDHARRFRQPFVLTTQVFAGDCCWTPPTVGQFRLMAYGALAEGAKGFCHYAYSSQPLHRQKFEKPQFGTMVDPYGTPSPIYDEIAQHLGPDLFSIGELLRTCRPADVPTNVTMQCGTVENALEQALPALAVTRLVDERNEFEIIAVYNNNPARTESGRLRVSKEWLGDRAVMDLSATAQRMPYPLPVLVPGSQIRCTLKPGDGRFYAIVPPAETFKLYHRMATCRLEAVRKRVEFDCRWLERVGVVRSDAARRSGAPHTTKIARPCVGTTNVPQAAVLAELDSWLQRDRENREIIRHSVLSRVLRELTDARNALSAAHASIATWARFKSGQPFPPEVEPGKSWCDAQDRLAVLHVGFSDLAFEQPPDRLVKPVIALAERCRSHAARVRKASARGVPPASCPSSPPLLCLESELHRLGWKRPPTPRELLQGKSQ